MSWIISKLGLSENKQMWMIYIWDILYIQIICLVLILFFYVYDKVNPNSDSAYYHILIFLAIFTGIQILYYTISYASSKIYG